MPSCEPNTWITSIYACYWVSQWYCNECNKTKTLNVCISASPYLIDFPFTGGVQHVISCLYTENLRNLKIFIKPLRGKFKIRYIIKWEPLLFHVMLKQGLPWFPLVTNDSPETAQIMKDVLPEWLVSYWWSVILSMDF